MRIEDHRNHSSWIPAISILEEFIPQIDQKYFIGIKKVILFDHDYHKDKKRQAAARYVPVRGTKFADIELYLDYFNNFPDAAKKSRMFIVWKILISLVHELYHHRIRGQNKVRRPKFEREQKDADMWAVKVVKPIFLQTFPQDQYEKEWINIENQFREQIEFSNQADQPDGKN